MKKILMTIMALVLTIAAQGQVETVDTAQFVAIYDYECRTLDDEDVPVTDRMQIVVQVGRTVTKSMPASSYRLPEEKSIADLKAEHQEAILHMPTVWTGWPEGQATVREVIFPHEFEGNERLRVGVPRHRVACVVHRRDSFVGRAVAVARSAWVNCKGEE